MWRDEHGRTLQDYEHPSVAVDVALLSVVDGGLAVLLHARAGHHEQDRLALPGTFVRMEESLAAAALRALESKVGVRGRAPEQLRVFDALDRDDRGRVLAVAHVDVVPPEVLVAAAASSGAVAAAIGDAGPVLPPGHARLAHDHDAVVGYAVDRVRSDHRRLPDPWELLGDEFTLQQLQQLHEAVGGRPLAKDTFRRRMEQELEPSGGVRAGVVGKPARLYRRRVR